MKLRHVLHLAAFGIKTILFKTDNPILGTVILTDDCNLNCKHCAVNNITGVHYSCENILKEMAGMYAKGVRILFFCGGEAFIWRNGDKDLSYLVRKAREMGFYIVNVVTNGTLELNVENVDILFVSIDGQRNAHNLIRGDTFDTIMKNIDASKGQNICVYMAINRLNFKDIEPLARIARDNGNIKSISFNFHTPYEGTEWLSLSQDEKAECVKQIKGLIKQGYPVFNLYSTLDRFLENRWPRPCRQCIVIENGIRYICGRCSEIPGLCDRCGYLFAVEFSLLFSGNIRVIFEALRTYLKFV
ncbi:MAG: radical SAM protein [Bacillota bacterium]|nr:radical SAM protein [Bacillota bacterium]